jgi:hypothetical protein
MDIGRQVDELSRAAQDMATSPAELRNTASLERIAEYLPQLVTALNILAAATEDLARKMDRRP